ALAQADRSRAGEAADGLERVARAALAANDRTDAARGLAGLRTAAPSRPLGRYARLAALDAADRGDTAGAMALLPGSAAAAAEAEDWFRRASAPGAPADVVRGAFIGLGDVKLAQGDVAAALENYQQALTGGTPGDTITQRAQQKINALGKADAPSPAPPKQP